MFPIVSIIIAVKKNNCFLEECIACCLKLDYPFFEIIVLPDEMMASYSDTRIKIFPTGNILPAAKRDIGANSANGQVFAFLDDDAYPLPDWLKNAVISFNDESIACVCGPAITPEKEPILRKASGMIFESLIVSGHARFRYIQLKKRLTDDFPSCNFFIRRDIFQSTGGFKTKFWPGEDTVLCLEVVYNLGKKILYDPNVCVYHHRRPLFKQHLKQISNYALHRGYFVKRFPKTSFKFSYFLPTTIVFVILLAFFVGILWDFKFIVIPIIYLFLVILFSLRINLKLFFYIIIGIILSHFAYGVFFLKGLLSRKLKEE